MSPTPTSNPAPRRAASRGTLLAILLASMAVVCFSAADWKQFRGNDLRNAVDDTNVPTTWSPEENMPWVADLPGKGVSGPIVVGKKVIVTASSGHADDRLHVICLDADSGKQLWHRQFWATGRTITHPTSAVAAPTPASDGSRIFAFFSSNDLICLDLDGNLLWFRGLGVDHPKASNDVGLASSPLVVDGTVVVQVENQGDSFAAGLDTVNGTTQWQVARDASSNWTTPSAIMAPDGESQLVLLQAGSGLVAHEPATGKVAWRNETPCSTIPSAAIVDEVIYVPAEGITALRTQPGTSDAKVLWSDSRLSPGNASPVIHEDRVYTVNRAGVLNCAEAATGKGLWKLRLKGSFWATPVVAGKNYYHVNQRGLAQVVSLAEAEGQLTFSYDLGEDVLASPAVADGALYIRGLHHLWKIAH
jgi:outer membrane protein assembly factor BamB